jgi:hypothetical protein
MARAMAMKRAMGQRPKPKLAKTMNKMPKGC